MKPSVLDRWRSEISADRLARAFAIGSCVAPPQVVMRRIVPRQPSAEFTFAAKLQPLRAALAHGVRAAKLGRAPPPQPTHWRGFLLVQ